MKVIPTDLLINNIWLTDMKEKKDRITPETIKKAIKVLKKHKVEKPYWVEIENPIEKGDPLEDILITPNKYDPISVAKYGGVRFLVK